MSFLVVGSGEQKSALSVVVIVPLELRERMEAAADFVLACQASPKGQEPATHYAMQASADQRFVDIMTNDPEVAISVNAADSPRAHIEAALNGYGLRKVTPIKGISK